MSFKPEQIPTIAPDTVWRHLDDGAVVVSAESGKIRVLNEVGTTIWQLIDGKTTLADIEEHMVGKYDISREEARQDLHAFVHELLERRLLTWETGPAS